METLPYRVRQGQRTTRIPRWTTRRWGRKASKAPQAPQGKEVWPGQRDREGHSVSRALRVPRVTRESRVLRASKGIWDFSALKVRRGSRALWVNRVLPGPQAPKALRVSRASQGRRGHGGTREAPREIRVIRAS